MNKYKVVEFEFYYYDDLRTGLMDLEVVRDKFKTFLEVHSDKRLVSVVPAPNGGKCWWAIFESLEEPEALENKIYLLMYQLEGDGETLDIDSAYFSEERANEVQKEKTEKHKDKEFWNMEFWVREIEVMR